MPGCLLPFVGACFPVSVSAELVARVALLLVVVLTVLLEALSWGPTELQLWCDALRPRFCLPGRLVSCELTATLARWS